MDQQTPNLDPPPPDRLSTQAPRARRPPNEHEQARRRLVLLWSKWLMPFAALALLGSIAAWPEFNRALTAGRSAMHQATALDDGSGTMLGVRYHGIDSHGQPYLITARQAHQVGPDRIDLAQPVADSLMHGGTWTLAKAPSGVYMPHEQILDLFGGVTFYRDDGTIMSGPDALVDVKGGVLASDDWVHAEGPFGVLDAQGELLSQRDGIAQFRGPARMILNDDHTPRPAPGAGRKPG